MVNLVSPEADMILQCSGMMYGISTTVEQVLWFQ